MLEKDDAYKREYENWLQLNAFEEIPRAQVPTTANIIGSHVIYKRKPDDSVKARIVPWGHRDSDKDKLRTDMPCMNVDAFRLLLSLAARNGWEIGEIDITAA